LQKDWFGKRVLHMTDTEFATLARQGDRIAFTGLVENYQTVVYNLCYRMLGDAHDAEDAAQETFLRAYCQLHRYDSTRQFSTWLLSIASHYCIDQLRKRRLQCLSLEDEATSSHPALRMPRTPEDVTLQHERESQMQAWLNQLDAASRQVVVLRYWYDLSYEEIAETLGSTVGAIKSRLHRARDGMAGKIESTLRGHSAADITIAPYASMVI
jgi:RNA polymerase sigma-70 factor (ECF subfamily)